MDEDFSFIDTYEPIFIRNSEKLQEKWLKIEEELIFNKEQRSVEEQVKDPLPPDKKIKFNIIDISLIKCKRCNALLKGNKQTTYCTECKRESNFDIITDNIDVEKNLWKIPIWNDIEIDMYNAYLDLLSILKKTIKFVEEIHYKLFALWIIASYKHPLWPTIPYLHFKGLPSSGKTRAMEMANLLAYRAVMVSGITFTAIVRINHVYQANLLIDEIDTKLDERTELGRQYIDFLKTGYKKGSMYITSDLNDQKKILYYNNYGMKILTGEKGIYNEALLSRTITFDMEQDFPEISNLSEVKLECDKLRNIFMNYRYKTDMPEYLGDEIKLKARYREIFDCIIRTAKHIGQPIDDILIYAKSLEDQALNEMQGTIQYDILRVIFDLSCKGKLDAPEKIKLTSILETMQWNDEPRKNSQKLGYILKNFGLMTKKQKDGTYLSLVDTKNDRKLNYLFKRYKVFTEDAER